MAVELPPQGSRQYQRARTPPLPELPTVVRALWVPVGSRAAERQPAQPAGRPGPTMAAPRERQALLSSAHPTRARVPRSMTVLRSAAAPRAKAAVSPRCWWRGQAVAMPPAWARPTPGRADSRMAPKGRPTERDLPALPRPVRALPATQLQAAARSMTEQARREALGVHLRTAQRVAPMPVLAVLPVRPARQGRPTTEVMQVVRGRTAAAMRVEVRPSWAPAPTAPREAAAIPTWEPVPRPRERPVLKANPTWAREEQRQHPTRAMRPATRRRAIPTWPGQA
ncbi:MAG TPA: hypothetical protein VHJ99_14160 [Candidatus Dormibacteraeota bacterium]|nr:hypothetical protein [Candidatus Dormibacteraeota bacterium]